MRTTGLVLVAALAPTMATANTPDPFRGARPIDTHWPEDQRISIEWKEDWEQTFEANKARWEKEVERLEGDRRQREARLRLRLVRLTDALIRRFPDETEKHIEGRRQMAEHLVRVGLRGRANYVLKQLVEDHPGRQDIAAWALKQILDWTPWDRPHETPEGRRWVQYAARRLLSLHRIGYLPATHSAIVRARQAWPWLVESRGDSSRPPDGFRRSAMEPTGTLGATVRPRSSSARPVGTRKP